MRPEKFVKYPMGDEICTKVLIVAASAAAVGNTEVDEDRQTKLKPWADAFGLTGEELQKMAVLGERQKDRVRSLASNLTI